MSTWKSGSFCALRLPTVTASVALSSMPRRERAAARAASVTSSDAKRAWSMDAGCRRRSGRRDSRSSSQRRRSASVSSSSTSVAALASCSVATSSGRRRGPSASTPKPWTVCTVRTPATERAARRPTIPALLLWVLTTSRPCSRRRRASVRDRRTRASRSVAGRSGPMSAGSRSSRSPRRRLASGSSASLPAPQIRS